MKFSNGISAAQMLQGGLNLLQTMYLPRGEAAIGKKQEIRLSLAMGRDLCAGQG